jgi:transcriptional regulator with XRE-family HTH domain
LEILDENLGENGGLRKSEAVDLLPNEEGRINSSLRMQYEAHVQVIRNQIGGLDTIRRELGLSQRKICQLLMVDPSAWTRWTKTTQLSSGIESAPPHIWRALQWYMILQQKIPGLTPEYFLGAREAAKMHQISEISEVRSELARHQAETAALHLKVKRLKSTLLLSLLLFGIPSIMSLWLLIRLK